MIFAFVSDIHGNLEAWEAVLRDIESRKVDKIYCLGDIVGYGCNPVECLDLVDKHCEVALMGNHEYVALGLLDTNRMNKVAKFSATWTQSRLTDKEMAMLADFPMDYEIDNLYLVHSSPYEPEKWHYIIRPKDAQKAFENFDQWIGFFGHSHLPGIFSRYSDIECGYKAGHDFDPDEDYRYLINVGSVGQPRDLDPRSSYVTFDNESNEVHFHRVAYDLELTQKKMTEADMHTMLVERLSAGR